jgi:hypothetical protein
MLAARVVPVVASIGTATVDGGVRHVQPPVRSRTFDIPADDDGAATPPTISVAVPTSRYIPRVIGIVWILLGLLWWVAILTGELVVCLRSPKGQRTLRSAAYVLSVGLVVGVCYLVPLLRIVVAIPIMFLPRVILDGLGLSGA